MDENISSSTPLQTQDLTIFKYKHTFSIVLLAVIDADYNFIFVDVGCNGRISDGGVFAKSPLNHCMLDDTLNFPQHFPLPGRQMPVPYVIIADYAFFSPTGEYNETLQQVGPDWPCQDLQLQTQQSSKDFRKCVGHPGTAMESLHDTHAGGTPKSGEHNFCAVLLCIITWGRMQLLCLHPRELLWQGTRYWHCARRRVERQKPHQWMERSCWSTNRPQKPSKCQECKGWILHLLQFSWGRGSSLAEKDGWVR